MSCVIRECRNSKVYRKENISFHRFPKAEDVREAWLNSLNINTEKWKWSQSKYVCSDHFYPTDYMVKGTRRYLRPNAVPHLPTTPCALNEVIIKEEFECTETSISFNVGSEQDFNVPKIELSSDNSNANTVGKEEIEFIKSFHNYSLENSEQRNNVPFPANRENGERGLNLIKAFHTYNEFSLCPENIHIKYKKEPSKSFYVTSAEKLKIKYEELLKKYKKSQKKVRVLTYKNKKLKEGLKTMKNQCLIQRQHLQLLLKLH